MAMMRDFGGIGSPEEWWWNDDGAMSWIILFVWWKCSKYWHSKSQHTKLVWVNMSVLILRKKSNVDSPFLKMFVELCIFCNILCGYNLDSFLWYLLYVIFSVGTIVVFFGTYIKMIHVFQSFSKILKFQTKYLLKSSIFQKIFQKLSFVHTKFYDCLGRYLL